MKIYTIGDPQFGDAQQEKRALDKVVQLKSTLISNDDILLIPGDLTDSGHNDTFINNKFYELFSCFYGEKPVMTDQLDQYVYHVHTPCDKLFSSKVYICHGNHDESAFPQKPVLDFVKKTHGSLDYCVPVGNNVVLICLGKCYEKSKRQKFQRWLEQNKDSKIIIMQHYYADGPAQWDFWDKADKAEFMSIVSKYKSSIVCVVEGHFHDSYTKKIEGVWYINGSGDNFNVFNVE